MADLTDEALMVMFQKGNLCAFERLFERYRIPLFSFLVRLLHFQRESAADLLQEIFIKLAKGKDLYDPRVPFRPWIYTIARNHVINHLRSRAAAGARVTLSFDALTAPTPDLPARELAGRDDTFGAVAAKDDQARLEQIIDRLPTPAREIFLLHALEGLPHAEIAQVLQMNPATVRTHYHRARAQLCQWLTKESTGGKGAQHGL